MAKKTTEEVKPERIEFEIEKTVVRQEKVVIRPAEDDIEEISELRDVYKSQDEAMAEALEKAKEMGYEKISLQNYTSNGYLFIAYN